MALFESYERRIKQIDEVDFDKYKKFILLIICSICFVVTHILSPSPFLELIINELVGIVANSICTKDDNRDE